MTSNFCVLVKDLELDLLFILLIDTCSCYMFNDTNILAAAALYVVLTAE